jgi:hypothetical protein
MIVKLYKIKNMKSKNILVIAFVAILFASCSDDGINNNTHNPFSFVKMGNEWNYTGEFIQEKHSTSYSNRILIRSEKDNFYSIATLPRFTYVIGEYEDDYGEVFLDLLRGISFLGDEKYTSIWFVNSNSCATIEKTTQLPFPLIFNENKVGKKWESPFEDKLLGTLHREILSISETVEVEAGVFTNCIKVKETSEKDAEYYYIYWITLKDGIIKYEKREYEDKNIKKYATLKAELQSKNF